MALTIRNPEAERLARELARKRGETVEDSVLKALQAQTESEERRVHVHKLISEIQDEVAKLPVLDNRSPDELLGYDESGLPH